MPPPPRAAPAQTPGGESPHLEYGVHLFSSGQVTVRAYLSPTLNFHGQGLRYAVSIDDQAPVVVNLHQNTSDQYWNRWVSDNINVETSQHTVDAPGDHVLKFWMVDSAVVLQKLVLEASPVKTSYLGPPENRFIAPEAAAAPSVAPVR